MKAMNDRARHVSRAATKRHVRFSAIAVLATVLLLAACGGGGGAKTPDSATLLKSAQTKFNATSSFHFIMTVANLGPVPVGGYNITGAKGDVQRPDKLSAKATASIGFASADVSLIIIGANEWITDPITQQYQPTTDYASFLAIFDPNQGIGSLLGQVQNPSKASSGSSNGASCWKISGTVPPDKLTPIFGSITATAPVPTIACIDKTSSELDSVTLNGAITSGDTAQTTRTFYLSNFDKPVSIQPPAGS